MTHEIKSHLFDKLLQGFDFEYLITIKLDLIINN